MSRFKRISYAVHPRVKVVDVVLVDPDHVEGEPIEHPSRWTTFGTERSTGLELDESDVRAIHAKLSEVIAGWDA
ncbi:hypothetical protein [Streptomyces sp. NBC_00197]|uniref:hypothetical protein n=1 Tax=Streptomyces sp. NBC_00197 TaxID=2975676 RepID=UPI00324848C5